MAIKTYCRFCLNVEMNLISKTRIKNKKVSTPIDLTKTSEGDFIGIRHKVFITFL